MEHRPLGSSGFELPAVGMGTWKTFDVIYPEEIEERRAVVDVALQCGTNLFDTSPMYGAAERVLAAALEGRREQAIVATKLWTPDDREAAEQIRMSFEYFGGHVEIYQVPLAAELDVGVLVMRPLGQGVLAAKSPPPEALECLARFGIRTWPPALLKWVLSDTRVTSVLPATTSLQHVQQNAVAGDPPWFGPDERDYVASLAERL